MIRGYHPSGYFVTTDADGKRVLGETRQCAHCQYTWEYRPGSGSRRGFCVQCQGLLCGRPACAAEQQRLLAQFPSLRTACLPFGDWNERLRDAYDHDPRYDVLPSGIVIARA